MSSQKSYYLGIDCGATTSKIGLIDREGTFLSKALRQSPTQSEDGAAAIIHNWVRLAQAHLEEHALTWDAVAGVGLAIPGPYLKYGVIGKQANLPESLCGWHFLDNLASAIQQVAGRPIPVSTANDGQLAGLAEAASVQAKSPGSVVMLAPGSGLGGSYIDAEGKLFSGDHQAAVIISHQPAPYELLGLPRFACGCGRDWGCHEAYTSISGLPQLLDHLLPQYTGHPLATGQPSTKRQALALRGLAQEGDPLAVEIFDLQARALGYTVAAMCMAYDPSHVIIGGGLIDPESTTETFRARYMNGIATAAQSYLWVEAKELSFQTASLGELSQAMGAALLARQLQI